MKIWVLATENAHAAELLGQALNWGNVRVLLAGDEATGREMLKLGAGAVSLMPFSETGPWQGYAKAILALAQEENPELIMVGSGRRARDVAGYLAAQMDIPCLSEVKSMDKTADAWRVSRLVYGGLALKTMEVKTPFMVTVTAGTFSAPQNVEPAQGEIKQLEYDSPALKVLARTPKERTGVDLNAAKVVVGVGRGFEKEEDLSFARQAADAMGGELGCTRPISEFFHWLPEDRYIGISGKVIKPALYVAVGISGQAQHAYGVQGAKVVVSVNKDENAAMNTLADYYIVGDYKEALPALAKAWQES